MLKLHPQFIHGLCPRNNQNAEQPEWKYSPCCCCARTHARTHTHTHTPACIHSHTHLPMCILEMERKWWGNGGENNWPIILDVGTCTHVTQHCHGNSMETSRQTIHKHWLYLYILHFWFTSYSEKKLLHGHILCWNPLVTFLKLPVNQVSVSHISLLCSKLKQLAPSFAAYCHIVYILYSSHGSGYSHGN